MVTINIDDIQRDLVEYLHRVQAGETLLVLEADQPVAEIKPFRAFGPEFEVGIGEPRPFGLCAGEFVVPDDFDAPLPEDILQDFERAEEIKMSLKFNMTLDRDEDGVWVVECPAIPGCVSQGQTREPRL